MADSTLSDIPTKRDGRSSPARRLGIALFNALTKRKYPKGYDSKSRLYVIWRAMYLRCHTPSHPAYHRYGGRGIAVCDEWRNDYMAFLNWALANGYGENLEIDRIDNDRGYGPDNCRWATPFLQNQNRRDNVNVTAFGETKTAKEWSRDPRCHVGYVGLLGRLDRGEDAEEAITRPSARPEMPPPVLISAFGETKRAEEWAADPRCKVGVATIYWRHRRGWPDEKIITHPARIRTEPDATHCARGHEFTEENARITPQGYRRCRACERETERRRNR